MKILSALLVVFFILVYSHASAQSSNFVFTGKEMYESFTHALKGLDRTGEYDDHRFGVCAGYIAGIVDFHTVATTEESLSADMFVFLQKSLPSRSSALSHNILKIIPANTMNRPLIS